MRTVSYVFNLKLVIIMDYGGMRSIWLRMWIFLYRYAKIQFMIQPMIIEW